MGAEALAMADRWSLIAQSWELFRDPILTAVVSGAVLGFLGVFVVLRRTVFLSAAVTQAAALGVAMSFFTEIHVGFHVDPMLGAGVLALLATWLVAIDPKRLHLTRDSLLGIAFVVASGLTVLVGAHISQEAHDIQAILFGSAVLVTAEDFHVVLVVGILLLVVHAWWRQGIQFAMFDAATARAQGVPVRLLTAFVYNSAGLMVAVSARALGAMPVFAFSVLPAAAALVLNLRLALVFWLATALGALSGGGGYLVAVALDQPVGGSQTVTSGVLLVVMVLVRAVLGLRQRRAGGPLTRSR